MRLLGSAFMILLSMLIGLTALTLEQAAEGSRAGSETSTALSVEVGR